MKPYNDHNITETANISLDPRTEKWILGPTPPGASVRTTGRSPLPRFETRVSTQHPCDALQVRQTDPMEPRQINI